jgi:3-dehydroquinate dehydratase-1
MSTTRSILVGGKPVAGGRVPVVCAPLVGRTAAAVRQEAAAVLAKRPDVLEWRVDFFEGIGRTADVLELARDLRAAAGAVPIIFTRRSAQEGGEPIALSEPEVVELYAAVCQSRCVDFVDYELGNPEEHRLAIRQHSRDHGTGLVLSFHDFEATPPLDVIFQKFADAERAQADVAKVAVMPQAPEDVLTLLQATLRAHRELAVPLISMSMGAVGSVSRMMGGVFGSALCFAVGQAASAPGQVPIEELRTVLEIVDRALSGPRR